MAISKHFLYAILQIFALFLPILVHGQEQEGFISIDCGTSQSRYTDEQSGLTYLSDTDFIQSGENREISPTYKAQTEEQQFWDLRSFPQGKRNCYTLDPTSESGTRYLIRARFLYGNYDGENNSPTFDLYVGVDFWTTVIIEETGDIVDTEILHIPSSDQINVCLVNTNFGTPFISVLELRPLKGAAYESDAASLLLRRRYDFGSTTNQVMRYKDDPYDRLWQAFNSRFWTPLNDTSLKEDSITKGDNQVPFTVLKTAYTLDGNGTAMRLNLENQNTSERYYFAMYFLELENLEANQTREFNIFVNNKLWYGKLNPKNLPNPTFRSNGYSQPDSEGKITIWFNSTTISTLPPLINAFEFYFYRDGSGQETYPTDINSISRIKSTYGVKIESWQGDPCSPRAYSWDGINCSYTDNLPPRIISLNLSSSGLKGEIVPSIANLTMLEYLDLSNNNLTGTIPVFLANLAHLKVLNLKGNNFVKPVPQALLSKHGLQISLDSNLVNDPTSVPKASSGKKKNFVVPIVASLGGVLFVVLITVFVIWKLKRRKLPSTTDAKVETISIEPRDDVASVLSPRNQQFSFSEVQKMTSNFARVLGEGGFGKVYHGYLNGNEVAVKLLSSSSVQGHRQFHAELKLLLTVHHKNLTTLVGYCNDGNNVALIYEYMAMGNLRSHISGQRKTVLSWEDRLRIVIDTAQGLEYLHNGCKPPIIHRDVKSTNILLNEKFQAKLGDFGLSKIFPLEGVNNVTDTGTLGITTSIAGTPGYLDPEYYNTNWLNEKSDVYSFGVVLLEIITGRPVLAKTRQNNHIIEWVRSMLGTGDIRSIIDPRLGGECDINTVWRTIEIAMACVSRTSSNRPIMSRVTAELKECLGSVLIRRDGRDVSTDFPKDLSSVEMISNSMILEDKPVAR